MLSTTNGILLFSLYGLVIILLVIFTRSKVKSSDDFLLMGRELGVFRGALSMAVSWIWAPAVFICALQAYTQGLPGVFWFTFPNIITFFIFAFFAVKMRAAIPNGYSILDVFKYKFPNENLAQKSASIVAYGYQLGAIIINCVAGATLINLLSGIPYSVGVLLMAGLALSYSLISGFRASVISDVAQMIMILVIAFIIVPWVVVSAGGVDSIISGLGGADGTFRNVFDPQVAYAFGIATTLGLISGPVADQMFSQRAFAAKKENLVKIFVLGGLIFGAVPIVLSILGFVGASASIAGDLTVSDPQMVGPIVVAEFLPVSALALFAIMAFAGLTSTLDSAFSAVGSMSAKTGRSDSSNSEINAARSGMVIFAIIGVVVALLKPQLLWVFLIYGALASAIFFPAFLSLFWKKTNGKAVGWGIISSFLVGVPLSAYANITQNTNWIVIAALISLFLSGLVCILLSLLWKSE